MIEGTAVEASADEEVEEAGTGTGARIPVDVGGAEGVTMASSGVVGSAEADELVPKD